MRHLLTNMKWILLLIGSLSLLVGCSSSTTGPSAQSPCDTPSNIRGTIVTISGPTGTIVGSILIDGTKEKTKAAYDKAYVVVRPDTQLFQKLGNQCQPVSFATFKVGGRVQVHSPAAAQSYPPQLDATDIVLLPPEP